MRRELRARSLNPSANTQTTGNSKIGAYMKKLLLFPLVAIGLALVPVKQADAQV